MFFSDDHAMTREIDGAPEALGLAWAAVDDEQRGPNPPTKDAWAQLNSPSAGPVSRFLHGPIRSGPDQAV